MDALSLAVSVAMDAVLVTLVLAMAALGLALIYGLIGVINLGHGAMLTIGAYVTWATTHAGIPFAAAVILAALAVALIGLAFEHFVVRHFYDQPFETLLITWGFFMITTEVIKIIFGTTMHPVTSPVTTPLDLGIAVLPAYRVLVAGISLTLIFLVAAVFYRTGLGVQIRAVIQNREVAGLMGVNIGRMYKLVFVVGCGLAGLAGGLLAPILSVGPYMGNIYLVRSFFVVIMGGVGQILGGTIVGSFLIGGSETIFALFSSQVFAQTIVFGLAIVVLRFRPHGILNRR